MSAQPTVSLHVPRFAVWCFAFLLIAPWLAFGAWLWQTHRTDAVAVVSARVTPAATVARTAPSAPDVIKCNPGPWGDLEYYRILIEPPEEFILPDYTTGGIRPWFFKGYTAAALTALWRDAHLDSAQQQFAENPAHREVKPDAILLHVDRDFIVGLSPESRATIYAALGAFPENFTQFNPFRLRTSLADDWLENADVPDTAVALTKQLFYKRGTATCFSDESVVLPTIDSPADRAKYIKALSRKSALMVHLRVPAGANVDALTEYWARGGRTKDLKPLLQSLARRPAGGSIDIVHLLPRFARSLLYTYPLPSERPIDANHDCHWTAFNFQNATPDERFSNVENVRQVLLDDYYPVPGSPSFGDVILFVRQDGVVVHSCVYIADDIVFTKNGPAYSIPWLLSPLADVVAFYGSGPPVEMRRYRPKKF